MMRKLILMITLTFFLIQCSKKEDPFLISSANVGKLSKDTHVSELDSVFKEDSLVKIENNTKFALGGKLYYEVYEKGGKQLLSITPSAQEGSMEAIQNVQVYDDRFTTDKGISLKSTFGDIKNKYKIKSIITTLRNIVVTLADSDIYFTISKEELPEDLRYGSQKIESVQIPEEARIKYMMIDLSPKKK